MGKKRRREDSEERLRRKLKKYSDKLDYTLNKKRRRIIYSSNEDLSTDTEPRGMDVTSPEPLPVDAPAPLADDPGEEDPGVISAVVETLEEVPSSDQVTSQASTSASAANDTEVALDNDTLDLLGVAPEPESSLGKAIHNDVAIRWLDILKKGLSKEVKEQFAKDYLIPSNCELLVPPILNAEAKAALTEPFVKRDSSLAYRQKQIGNALAALAPAIDVLISKDCDPNLRKRLLKPVGDACKIMCDMHHTETKLRKKFVISSISSNLKDTLVNASTDKYLFGDNMTEKIKAAKTVQKSGEALKVPTKVQKPAFTRPFNRSNFKPLHQKTAGRQDAGKNQSTPRQQSSRPAPPSRRGRTAAPASRRSPSPPPPRRHNHHR